MSKKNVLTRSKKVKADELIRQGRLEEAGALLAKVSQTDPGDVETWIKLSETQRRLNRFDDAERSARRAVTVQPQSNLAQLALGLAFHARGVFDEAIASYRQAIALQPNLAEAHYMLGNAILRAGGDASKAIESYRTALKLQPEFVDAMCNLASVLGGLGELEEAAAIIHRVVDLRPKSPQLLCDMGNVMQIGGRIDEAEALFRRALVVAPDSLKAIGSLGRLLEKTGRLPEAGEMAERGLQCVPNDPVLVLTAAKIARREGRARDGIELLEKLLGEELADADAAEVRILLGQLYDRTGDAARAFPLFVEGNRLAAKASLQTDENKARYLKRALDSLGRFSSVRLPAPPLRQAEDEAPIFMIGFPRSGTTLLEQILDSHPDLQSLEEKGTVAAMMSLFLTMAQDDNDALANLDQGQIARLRRAYFEEAARHVTLGTGARLVDKMPLNTANVPLIWRVFPNAKFILSIRHPCDVCLSCFMQNFAVNEGMAGFFTLEDTATVYGLVMGAWRRYERELPLDCYRIRYEDLIEDVEGQTRQLLGFIGVPWNALVMNHAEHARQRSGIQTPSYHQVTQPIYQRAKYRWQRYRKEFEPVMDALSPFIDYFGYGNGEDATATSANALVGQADGQAD